MTQKVIKKEILIEPINIKEIVVPIKGVTNLIMDRFPDEAKKQILAKQTGVSKSNKKMLRDTKKEIQNAIHVTSTGKVGFPADGFKKGMMEATSFVGDKFFSKKLVSGLQIVNTIDGLILLKYKKQTVLEHNIESNTKFSPQFHDWECELKIRFDANNISENDIVTLLNYAGYYIGIGAWRPKGKKGGSGSFGMYEVKQNVKKKNKV